MNHYACQLTRDAGPETTHSVVSKASPARSRVGPAS